MGRITLVIGVLITVYGWFRMLNPTGGPVIFDRQYINIHELVICVSLIITGIGISLGGLIQNISNDNKKKFVSTSKAENSDLTHDYKETTSSEITSKDRASALRLELDRAQAKLQK